MRKFIFFFAKRMSNESKRKLLLDKWRSAKNKKKISGSLSNIYSKQRCEIVFQFEFNEINSLLYRQSIINPKYLQ